jgi:hypothetical protein
VRFLIPGATVALITKVRQWKAAGKRVVFRNHQSCPARGYLQRMDFFDQCGIRIEEDFRRHAPRKRFVEVKQIAHGAKRSVTDLSADIADCFFPDEDPECWETGETGAYGYVEFAVSELANNVLQHSRSTGYLAAQYYPSSDLVRIGIADYGIGIRESLRGSPFEAQAASDVDAVRLALEPRVSGKEHLELIPGTSVNRGMGLTYLRELSEKADGEFLVLSDSGYYSFSEVGSIAREYRFQGTFCALSVTRVNAGRYRRLLQEAKRRFGLTSEPATYSGLFL